jgi:hypothetical protein
MSFMSDRTMRFAFDGEIKPLISVNSGTPQGSPISPIIFLIYLQPIFQALGYWPEIEAIAYIDDIIIVTGSTCARTNGIRLQLAIQRLCRVAERSQIQFDIDKTEYIYFHKERAPIKIGITINTGFKTIEMLPQEQIK